MTGMIEPIQQLADLGGPVIVILLAASIYVLAVALYKTWQFRQVGVGRHRALQDAVNAWDAGDRAGAVAHLSRSQSYLVPVVEMALRSTREDNDRLVTEAERRFAGLERGLRSIETIAQLAPLLGLFGTVLGMIQAFQAMQEAGTQVDPSILAGGIWVALMTTAAGLAVAMPSSLIHSWLEARMDEERGIADHAIQTALRPRARRGAAAELAGTPQDA